MRSIELPRTAEVVIVGGGVLGASLAHHLARRGCRDVVLLERENLFGAGATARCAGGIRHQFGSEINIRLSLLSLPVFDEFEQETGREALVRKCGYFFVLTRPADVEVFERNVALQQRLGVRSEMVDGDEVRRRLPLAHFPDALAGSFCADDGLADPASVVDGYIGSARRQGVACASGVEVTGIDVEGGRVASVVTSSGTIATRTVVNAAGPWAAQIGHLAGVTVPVAPVRRQWLTTTPLSLPVDLPFVIDFGRSLYFHRESAGLLTGMSNNAQAPGFDQSVDVDWELLHLEAAVERLPLLEQAGVTARAAGLYEVTPDAHPLIGETALEGFHLLTGFSGHGFMHAPACGLLLAELLLDGEARTLDVAALSPRRFDEGRALVESGVV